MGEFAPLPQNREIAANANVEICIWTRSITHVRITGTAEIVGDRQLLREIWDTNPLLRQYLGSLEILS